VNKNCVHVNSLFDFLFLISSLFSHVSDLPCLKWLTRLKKWSIWTSHFRIINYAICVFLKCTKEFSGERLNSYAGYLQTGWHRVQKLDALVLHAAQCTSDSLRKTSAGSHGSSPASQSMGIHYQEVSLLFEPTDKKTVSHTGLGPHLSSWFINCYNMLNQLLILQSIIMCPCCVFHRSNRVM
jgi:hypothetical protein